MNKIGDHYYDAVGVCPECGAGLRPVVVYSAQRLGTQVSRKRRDINTVVKTTAVRYGDIKSQVVGCCLACQERAHAAKEEARAAKRPKPAPMILAALGLAAAVLGMSLGIRADGTADVHTARGMLGIVSIFVSFPALIWLIWALVAYIKKGKLHKKYASGWREPFKAPSEEDMSSSAAFYMNKLPAEGREYLSAGQVKRMQNPLYGRY